MFLLTASFLPLVTQTDSLAELPGNVQAVVAVNDFERSWKLCQSLSRKFEAAAFKRQFAIAPSEVADLVEGELWRVELIMPDGALVATVTASLARNGSEELKKIHERLQREGSRITATTFGAHTGSVIIRRDEGGAECVSVHLVQGGRVVMTNSVAAAESMVTGRDTESSLTNTDKFAAVWGRCSPPLADEPLAMAWYVDPWIEARVRQQNGVSQTEYETARRHGLTGIVAVGGNIVFGDEGAESIRAWAWTEEAPVGSLQMGTHLTGSEDLVLPSWVSEVPDGVAVVHGEIDKALAHIGPLFDDAFAEGVEGTYNDVLKDLRDLLDLDIEKELYPQLGPNAYLLYAAQEHARQRMLIAFNVKDARRVAEIIRTLVVDDPEVDEIVLGEESNRVWYVEGQGAGRDFVLGVLRGVAVYANDLNFAKAAMRFDGSGRFIGSEQLAVAVHRATQGRRDLPSVLLLSKANSANNSSVLHPLEFIFRGTSTIAKDADPAGPVSWLPQPLTAVLTRYPTVVGFQGAEGWEFVTHSGQ
jgi:hypothetical protein